MAKIRTASALMAIAVCASGCGGAGFQIREALGVDKNPPDAFVVMPTRALEIPQDLAALPPPAPGAVSPLEADPRAMALSALGGQPVGAQPIAPNTVVLGQAPLGAGSLGFSAPGSPAAGFAAPGFAASAPLAYAPAPSGAESALLSAAGAPAASGEVRALVAAEAAEQPEYLLDRWFPGLKRLRGESSGELVEPLAEMRRLGQDAPEAAPLSDVRAIPPLLLPPSASAASASTAP